MRQGMVGVVLAAIAAIGGVTANAQGESPAVRPEDAAHTGARRQRHGTIRDVSRPENPARSFRRHRLHQVLALRWKGRGVPGLGIGRRRHAAASDLARQVRPLTRRTDGVAGARASTRKRGGVRSRRSRTSTSFRKSFASRGWKHGAGFETGEATRITRQVAAELSGKDSAGVERRRP